MIKNYPSFWNQLSLIHAIRNATLHYFGNLAWASGLQVYVPNFNSLIVGPVMMCLPSGLKATDCIMPLWPSRDMSSLPFVVSQTLVLLSSLAVTMRLPSGLKAADHSMSVWSFRERSSFQLAASHTFAVLSLLAVTISLPSGLKATEVSLAEVAVLTLPVAQFS
jgi:hypothetical protein